MTGNGLLHDVTATASSVGLALGPLVLLFAALQATVLKLPRREVARIVAGSLLAAAGLFTFLLGVAVGFLPFGRLLGEYAAELPATWLVVPFGALLGFVTSWGEPSVRVLAAQVEDASGGSVRGTLVLWVVCLGVAVAGGIGLARAAWGLELLHVVLPGYLLVLCLSAVADRRFLGIAVDAGGVATGPLANTFLLALALGAAGAFGRDDPLVSGLGLVALIALAPVVAVTVLGVVVRWTMREEPGPG